MSLKGIDFAWQPKRLELDTKIKPFESEDEDLNNFFKKRCKKLFKTTSCRYLLN